MELLIPLGLLGLLSILVLIIIYIIKPNYLAKHVPTTYVWELSLKYRRKKIPTSKLRHLLIFLCQVLILTLIAAILATPAIVHHNSTEDSDVIIVLDSSASMYTEGSGTTRFERALDETEDIARETFASGGKVSVILADGDPDYLGRRVTPANSARLYTALDELRSDRNACFYGSADVTAAMKLCEEVLDENPSAGICLVTDTIYDETYLRQLEERKGIRVYNVNETAEWNAAILGAEAQIVDTYFELTVEIACYNRSPEIDLHVEIYGAGSSDATDEGRQITLVKPVLCDSDAVKKVVFKSGGGVDSDDTAYYSLNDQERFQSFRSIHVSIDEDDSFRTDNAFEIYGGQREVLKVQYASSRDLPTSANDPNHPGPNIFVNGALAQVKNAFARQGRYDVQITEVAQGKEPALEGFDVYIFEHDMPETLPSDGVVLLLDPTKGWAGYGINVMEEQDFHRARVTLMENPDQSEHPVLKDPNGFSLVADSITVSKYKVISCDPDYDILMTCTSDPVLMVRKQGDVQIAVMAFSVHYSSIGMSNEMFYFFYNVFDYYFPALVDSNAYEVGDTATFNTRGTEVTFSGREEPFTEFPAQYQFVLPGTYTVSQTTWFDKSWTEEIYVKIPAEESNIWKTEIRLSEPNRREELRDTYDDLLIYFAAALLVLVVTERCLHAYEIR